MINGTHCIILKNGIEIIGQMDSSVNYGGELVRIDNPSLDKWVEYLDKKLSARNIEISGSIVYNNSLVYESIKHDAYNGSVDTYTFMFAETGERIDGLFMPTGMSDAVPHGDKVSTTITFKSSEEVARTPQSNGIFTGVQIGQAIITPETVWHNSNDEPVFDLLPVNSSFDVNVYTELAVLYPSGVLPNITQETGSPFPYKYVADYTGV